MKPVIAQIPSLLLAGFSFYGDPFETSSAWSEENQIGRLWVRFFDYLEHNADRIPHRVPVQAAYEVHIYNEETLKKGLFEVFVGMQIDQVDAGLPIELLVKVLPAAEYARFTLQGEQIVSDWVWQVNEWVAAAGYQHSAQYSFQYYDERFKSMDRIAESAIDVYIPVTRIPDTPA